MAPKTRGGMLRKEKSKNTTKKNSKGTSRDSVSKGSTSQCERYAVSGSEEEITPLEDKDDSDTLPRKPEKFFFQHTDYHQICKIQTMCSLTNFLEIIEGLKPELQWFKKHPQFKHIFHMEKEANRKLQGFWMLLLQTVCVARKTMIWFVVNGVPIRYSLREHGLICGFYCHDYPNGINPKMSFSNYKSQLKEKVFQDMKKVTINDVKEKLVSMKKSSPERLKIAILYFLSAVLGGKAKSDGNISAFLFRMAEDPELCKSFPWGRVTYQDSLTDIYYLLNRLNGSAPNKLTFPGFVIPLEVFAFECIPNLKRSFREVIEEAHKDCPRMCKAKFTTSSMKGYSLEEIYDALGSTKDIHSILEPEIEEESLLERILEDVPGDIALDEIPESWNERLEARKKICWEELYNLDVASRAPKEEQEEEIGLLQDSEPEKNPDLLKLFKDLEDRLTQKMTDGFDKVNDATKVLDKKVRQLRRKVKVLRSEVRSRKQNSWDGVESGDHECGYEYEGGGYEYEGADYENQEATEKGDEDEEMQKVDEEEETQKGDEEEETEKENEEEGSMAMVVFTGVVDESPIPLVVEVETSEEEAGAVEKSEEEVDESEEEAAVEKSEEEEAEEKTEEEEEKEETRVEEGYGSMAMVVFTGVVDESPFPLVVEVDTSEEETGAVEKSEEEAAVEKSGEEEAEEKSEEEEVEEKKKKNTVNKKKTPKAERNKKPSVYKMDPFTPDGREKPTKKAGGDKEVGKKKKKHWG